MKMKSLETLVADAITLDREIAEKTEALKALKADLVALAFHRPTTERTDTEGGGWSLTLDGGAAGIARVTQPGPKLKSSVDFGTKKGEALLKKIGEEASGQLFDVQIKNVPVDDFRERVEEMYSPAKAASIIAAMTSESAATVSFETKEAL